MADLREEIEKLRKKLLGKQITSMEEFEKAYAALASVESKENLDEELKILHKQAEEEFKVKTDEQHEEVIEPEQARVDGEEASKEEPKAKTSAKKGATKKEPTKKEPTKKEPTKKAKDSKKKADKKEEKPKKSKIEKKIEKAAKDFKEAETNANSAKDDLDTLKAQMEDEKRKYDDMKAAIANGVKKGTIKREDLLKQAKAYNEILKKVSKQLEVVGKLNKVKDKAKTLNNSMQNFKSTYEKVKESSERTAHVYEIRRDALETRKSKDNTKQDKRLKLSQRKMGRMMLKGALKKDLTVYSVKKLSFALRGMGLHTLADKLDKGVVDRAKSIDKGTRGQVKREFLDRRKIEDKVDITFLKAKEEIEKRRQLYHGKTDYLTDWKDATINNSSPFKRKIAEWAAGRENAAQLKALKKYKNAVERTQIRLEKDIVKGRNTGTIDEIEEDFDENIQKANETYDSRSTDGSRAKRFVDKGNTIREQINRARAKQQTKDELRFAKMEANIEKKEIKENEQQQKEVESGKKQRLGTKTKLKLVQRGRHRRFENMVLEHDMKGSTRRTAANIAAFLGLKGMAKSLDQSAQRGQQKLLKKEMSKVFNGSKLERAALNVGEATLNMPELVGEGVVKGAEYAVGKAADFVETSKEVYANSVIDQVDKRAQKVLADIEKFENKGEQSQAQDRVETKTVETKTVNSNDREM